MLDDVIQTAAARAAADQQDWSDKHVPMTVGDKTIWLSTRVPDKIQSILDVLPDEPESGAVKRPHQIKSRMSDGEFESFSILLKTSGLTQAEYIRGMVLNGRISVTQTSLVDQKTLEELTAISGTLGKIAGMIRMTVITNKEFGVLTEESKKQLEAQLRALRNLQSRIQVLAEEIYGNL